MRPICTFLLPSLLAIFSCSAYCTATETSLLKQIENIIIQENINKGFNGSVAIKFDDEPIVSYHFGYQQEGIPLTSEHVFSSGSVGKEFTTVALLKLANERKLDLNDTVANYLPDLPLWAERIRIHHLLAHTSGLPKVKWKTNITTADVMNQVLAIDALEFEPGSKYLYGNINVMLRAKIVEAVTGLSFEQFLSKNFLKPFNMANTLQVTIAGDVYNQVVGDYPTAINGVTIYTTPADLIRWELALLDGKALSGSSVVNVIAQHPISARQNHSEYDFGKFTMNNGDVATIEHDGSNPSHHVLKYTHIANRLTIVAMSSDGNKQILYSLRDKIEDLLLAAAH